MGETDNNKSEYAGGSDDLLEQRYLSEYIPVYDDTSGIWCVQMGYGFERGAVDYIAASLKVANTAAAVEIALRMNLI